MQLDDDITFDEHTIGNMVQTLSALGRGHVIGPLLYDKNTKQPGFADSKLLSGVNGLYLSTLGGLPRGEERFGSFSIQTCSLGLCDRFITYPLHRVDWLSGGFVLGYRSELITREFYPFSGKALCEDLIHSQLRSKHGLVHFVATQIPVYTEIFSNSPHNVKFSTILTCLLLDLKGIRRRWGVGRLLGSGKLVLFSFLFFETIIIIKRFISQLIKKYAGIF
jgi:hypothetical protein